MAQKRKRQETSTGGGKIREGRRAAGYALAGKLEDEDPEEFHACARKRRYATSIEAKKAAAAASKRKDAPKLSVYQCPWCAGWHLTHRKPR